MKLYDLGKPSSPNREYTVTLMLDKAAIDAIPNLEDMEKNSSVRIEGLGKITENRKVTLAEGDTVDKQQTIVIKLEALAVVDENSEEASFKEPADNSDDAWAGGYPR
jgi:hypothetical protein